MSKSIQERLKSLERQYKGLCCKVVDLQNGGDAGCFQPVVQEMSFLSPLQDWLNRPMCEIQIYFFCEDYRISQPNIINSCIISIPNITFTSLSEIVNYMNTNFSSILGYNFGTFTLNGSTVTISTTTQFTVCPSLYEIGLNMASC